MLTCFGPHLMHVDKAWPHSFARFTALFVFAHYKKFSSIQGSPSQSGNTASVLPGFSSVHYPFHYAAC